MNSLNTLPLERDTDDRFVLIPQPRQTPVSAEALHMCHCLQPILIIVRYRIVRSLSLERDFEPKGFTNRTEAQDPIEEMPKVKQASRIENSDIQSKAESN